MLTWMTPAITLSLCAAQPRHTHHRDRHPPTHTQRDTHRQLVSHPPSNSLALSSTYPFIHLFRVLRTLFHESQFKALRWWMVTVERKMAVIIIVVASQPTTVLKSTVQGAPSNCRRCCPPTSRPRSRVCAAISRPRLWLLPNRWPPS